MNPVDTQKKLLSLLDNDPVKEKFQGKEVGKEYLYTLRLLDRVKKLDPDMSDAMRLAVCGHHLYRWRIPRERYPMDRQGYNEWRMKLMFLHAEETAKILEEEGYSPEFIQRVKTIILKKNLKTDPEVQVFEDAINLTFLEYYMEPFSKKHSYDKLVDIARKIIRKMSPKAIDIALNLKMDTYAQQILEAAMQK